MPGLAFAASTGWGLFCSTLVWLANTGQCFLITGSGRVSCSQNTLLKQLLSACVGGVAWWAVGYGIAYGHDEGGPSNPVVGTAAFFSVSHGRLTERQTVDWLVSHGHAVLYASIISGATVERITLPAFAFVVLISCGLVFPAGAHWLWSAEGWLSSSNPSRVDCGSGNGVLDHAGAGVVHLAGGVSALVAACMVGPRCLPGGESVFSASGRKVTTPHNRFSVAAGTLILWTAWFGVTAGPHPHAHGDTFVVSVIGAAASALCGLLLSFALLGHTDIMVTARAGVGGLVAVGAGGPFLEPVWSVAVGAVAGCLYYGASYLRQRARVDDVTDAFAVHGVCGLWGMVSVGLFTRQSALRDHGLPGNDYGLLLGGGGGQLAAQMVASVTLAVWSALCTAAACLVLRRTIGLRESSEAQLRGLDFALHESAGVDYAVTIDQKRRKRTSSALSFGRSASDLLFGGFLPDAGQHQCLRKARQWSAFGIVLAVTAALPHVVADTGHQHHESDASSVTCSALEAELEHVRADIDGSFTLTCGILVFLMQAGFCFLEAGAVRGMNVQTIIFKNFGDCCIGGLAWWACGYGLAYGRDGDLGDNPLLGNADFFLLTHGSLPGSKKAHWFLSYTYTTAAGTIISGAVAERVTLSAYYLTIAVVYVWSYPVLVHWVWSAEGWLAAGNPTKVVGINALDFAGGAIIHAAGGVSALAAAHLLGPRRLPDDVDLWSDDGQRVTAPHNRMYSAIGTLLLWTSWYAFNAGSVGSLSGNSEVAAHACLTTTLSSAMSGATAFVLTQLAFGKLDIGHVCNATLGGLVGITAGCAYVEPQWAVLIGMVSAFVYVGAHVLRVRLHIDDVVDAGAVHGACGMWGTLAVGLCGDSDLIKRATGQQNGGGLFTNGNADQLAAQVLLAVCTLLWSVLWVVVTMAVARRTIGIRVPLQDELVGLDKAAHGGSGYDYIDKLEMERDEAMQTVRMMESINDCVVRFDLESAESVLQMARKAQTTNGIRVVATLEKLVCNLREYRPYLPESLFNDDSDSLSSFSSGAAGVSTQSPRARREYPVGPEVCIVFTDVESSTKIWEAAGDDMAEALKLHNAVLRTALEQNNGYEVKVIGDAFMAAFDTATDAVRFSLGGMTALVDARWPEGLLQYPLCSTETMGDAVIWNGLRVRIGAHLGVVNVDVNPVTKRADYFGNTVNKASRCESNSIGGLIAVTPEVMGAVQSQGFMTDVVQVSLGKVQLKGVKDKVELTGLVHRALEGRRSHFQKVLERRAHEEREPSSPRVDGRSPIRPGAHIAHKLVRKLCSILRVQPNYHDICGADVTSGADVLSVIATAFGTVEDRAERSGGRVTGAYGGSIEVSFNLSKACPAYTVCAIRCCSLLRAGFSLRADHAHLRDLMRCGVAAGPVFWGNVGSARQSFAISVSEVVGRADLAAAAASTFGTFACLSEWETQISQVLRDTRPDEAAGEMSRLFGVADRNASCTDSPMLDLPPMRPIEKLKVPNVQALLYVLEVAPDTVSRMEQNWDSAYRAAFEDRSSEPIVTLSTQSPSDAVLALVARNKAEGLVAVRHSSLTTALRAGMGKKSRRGTAISSTRRSTVHSLPDQPAPLKMPPCLR
eukprot:TRINITY_DN7506_c1_g1_i1.p1 TRINITY_DN7506_c1_g1~~TRINITY_DN7506_c1_g1_i1.p1  ORF type:complete len:1606 (+),score=439.86 TRINITY_DN7506_c1_g1_i1:61-4878(+)